MASSLTSEDIMRRAISNKPISKDETLAIYADGENWGKDYNGPEGSCRWIWKGPTICPLDPALWALEYGEK